MMLKRFADIESLLDKVYERVSKIVAEQHQRDRQINLSTALECAQVVANAEDGNYKESMAANLDFLLINAREHCMSDFCEKRHERAKEEIELAQQRLAQAMHLDETRIRAFLEVGQDKLAESVMQDRLEKYRTELKKYVSILLGRHPQRAIYFNHKVGDQDLQRYVLIEQWLRGEEDILWDIVLEQRKGFWSGEVKNALEPSQGIVLPGKPSPKASTQHLDALAQAEAAIENFQRFEGFALELKAINRLGISLDDWEAMRNTQNTVFVNEADINLAEHDDYVLLVDKEWSDTQKKSSAA